MDRMEEELRKALRREPPPAGFAQRIIDRARMEAQSVPAPLSWRERLRTWIRLPRLQMVAAAAALVVIVASGVRYEQYRSEQRAGEHAKEQVLLALRVAGSKIEVARERVQELSEPQPSSTHQ